MLAPLTTLPADAIIYTAYRSMAILGVEDEEQCAAGEELYFVRCCADAACGRRLTSTSFTTTGDCSATGDCVTSPNYPSDYDNSQSCTITPQSIGSNIWKTYV